VRVPGRLALAACLLAAAAAAADEAEPDDDTIWQDVARPGRARVSELTDRGAALLERLPSEAAALLEQAVALDPRRPLAHYLLGLARYRERAWGRCADALQTVERLDPEFAPPGREGAALPPPGVDDMLGICLTLAGRHDDAVAHYREMLLAPSPGVALDVLHGNLGDCYLALGRIDEAVAEYLAGLALAPRRAILWYALAVAYDRDERVSRAREAMLRALELDPQLGDLASPGNFFVPAEDVHYYHGLAHQVAAEVDPPRRAAAIAHFRRYVAVAPPGGWGDRARRHLGALGATTLGLRDVTAHPHEDDASARQLAAALPDLQRCLEGHPHLATRLTLTFTARSPREKYRAPPATGTVTLLTLAGGPAPAEVTACVERRAQAVRHAAEKMTRVSVVVIAR
jgi:tetratricopeptide (TPR) repeat protein